MDALVEYPAFGVAGETLRARLYLPQGLERPPVVVMGHGFGALMDFGLEPFALRFVERGLAVLMFDYRHFGHSGGSPRQFICLWKQLNDWRGAIALARSLPTVNGTRLGLWGSSFSGGHVVLLAAGDPAVGAVVSQVPHVDGVASARLLGTGFLLKGLADGLADAASALVGRGPHRVPIYGPPGGHAFLRTPDAAAGYAALVPPDAPWQNSFPARTFLWVGGYRPTMWAAKVKAPMLVVAARGDKLIPHAAVLAMARKAPRAEVLDLGCGHFDVYHGEPFERAVAAEADFLARHLGAA